MSVRHHLPFALRTLRRHPGFAITAIPQLSSSRVLRLQRVRFPPAALQNATLWSRFVKIRSVGCCLVRLRPRKAFRQRKQYINPGSFARLGRDFQIASQTLGPLLHADQAETSGLRRPKATTVVLDSH